MKKITSVLLLIISINASAQNKIAEKFAATITPEALKAKLTVIAGEAMEGRNSDCRPAQSGCLY